MIRLNADGIPINVYFDTGAVRRALVTPAAGRPDNFVLLYALAAGCRMINFSQPVSTGIYNSVYICGPRVAACRVPGV